MTIMKRLLLTGLTTWSLGVGAALAQDGGMGQSYWADQYPEDPPADSPEREPVHGRCAFVLVPRSVDPRERGPGSRRRRLRHQCGFAGDHGDARSGPGGLVAAVATAATPDGAAIDPNSRSKGSR